MRILCVAALYPPHGKGGGPKATETIVKAISSRGHTVRVVTVADSESIELRGDIEVKTVRSLNLYWDYCISRSVTAKLVWHLLENFNPRALLRMYREIAIFRPDIVLTVSIENVNVATWIASWLLGCPSVHAIQSYFLLCWRGSMFCKGQNCQRPCLRCRTASIGKKLCSQLVDGVIAEASHSVSIHRKQGYFTRAQAKVIPGAISAPTSTRSFRDADTGAVRVGFIGMLTPNKGIGTLGDAAALLGEDAPFEFFIAGDGKPEFIQTALSKFPSSKTSYLGWVDFKLILSVD